MHHRDQPRRQSAGRFHLGIALPHRHDNEHGRYTDQRYFCDSSLSTPKVVQATHNPFAGLAGLLKED